MIYTQIAVGRMSIPNKNRLSLLSRVGNFVYLMDIKTLIFSHGL